LENISAELKPGHIIYFEDPFGKTEYERREGLEREIGTIIETVKQVEDIYVIITSREEVFKEFEKEKIKEKTKETAKAFADEIKNMTDDKILFLSFLFIRSLEVEFVREMYQELEKELNLKDAWEFDSVLNWFKDDKISISGGGYSEGGYGEGGYGGVGVPKHIELSHPAYSEALPYLLVEGGCITRINREIFSKLLLKLSKKIFVVASVAHAVKDNFDKLPEKVRNLLDRLQKLLQQLILGIYQGGGLQQALNLISNALPKINPDFVEQKRKKC